MEVTNKTKVQLEQEWALAKAELKQAQAKTQPPAPSGLNNDLTAELSKIRTQGKVNTNSIPVKTIDDHINIALYTPLNKLVGPLHPRNAEQTMQQWYAAGIPLYTTKRTAEQISEYKTTPEYKEKRKKHENLRESRHRNTSKSALENLSKVIAKQTGKAIGEMNSVAKQD